MELELESILLPGIEEKRPLVIAGPCSAELWTPPSNWLPKV